MPEDSLNAHTLHHALVDHLKQSGALHDPHVEAAFRAVPRHLFVPDVPLAQAYADDPIPTKFENNVPISSSSQPAIMAIMLEQLDLQPGQRVLEIGAGTGYNAALMAQLVGPTGRVWTIDLDADLVETARAHLAAAGVANVNVIEADGALGHAAAAPFDRIILTVGAWEVALAWWEQLAPGGRLVLPLALLGAQKSVAFERAGDQLRSVSVRNCGFMRLRGSLVDQAPWSVPLGPDAGLLLTDEQPLAVDAPALYQRLLGSDDTLPTDVAANWWHLTSSLAFWLKLREPTVCALTANDDLIERYRVPCLIGAHGGQQRVCTTFALIEGTNLAIIDGVAVQPGDETRPPLFKLGVRGYGSDHTLAQRLHDHIVAWDAAGRPAMDDLRVRVYRADAGYTPIAGELVLPKRATQVVLAWPAISGARP